MSKLAGIGDRIKAKKIAHDRKADEWAARLDAIEKREPEAFAIAEAVMLEREADLAELESTVRTLGNIGPFVGFKDIARRLGAVRAELK